MSTVHITKGSELVKGSPAEAVASTEMAVPRRRRRHQRGMTTAEYAVGTVAAVSFAGVLIKILTDPTVSKLILDIILWILKKIAGF
ncbi:MAG: DUF4244 domain-containing protein [Propionibacteriales bacterium]|nr:DUF4244 domain-containing protein [Propionibacteriales bacterium]